VLFDRMMVVTRCWCRWMMVRGHRLTLACACFVDDGTCDGSYMNVGMLLPRGERRRDSSSRNGGRWEAVRGWQICDHRIFLAVHNINPIGR
jgi:hypothetical protein